MKIERLFDILFRYISHFPSEEVLGSKKHGVWKKYGIEEIIELIDTLSIGFLRSGVKPGDRIAIISNNRPEWNFVDFACQQSGAISVPVYSNFSEQDIRIILKETEVKYIFVSDGEMVKKVEIAAKNLNHVEGVFSFDFVEGTTHWSALRALSDPSFKFMLDESKAQVNGDDIVSIVYTSGTTGRPKGVALTHKNIIKNIMALSQVIPLEPGAQSRTLSFLPLSNMFERSAIYMYLYFGCHIFYAENQEKITENIQEIKPLCFTAIPGILVHLYSQIMKQAHSLKGWQRAVFYWAFKLGLKYKTTQKEDWWYKIQVSFANYLVFNKFRNYLGGNIKFIFSGAETMPLKLNRLFWSANIKILEGYGLTETSPAISISTPEDVVLGTAGRPVEGVSVKIAEDGEILVKGPNVMKGYYNNPELTREVIDGEGWFHTGDLGEIVQGGYLKIKDRKKEIFQTSAGRSIAPQALEKKFKESDLVEQIMIIGENELFTSALIVPGKEAVEILCKQHKIPYTTMQEILKNPEVKQHFIHELEKHNETCSQFEKIKKFLIIPESWGIQTGELTPTLKIKRKYILEKYHDQIAGL
nr:long-chain fatty acid--CoA ligase [Bacteroidota bacterium]